MKVLLISFYLFIAITALAQDRGTGFILNPAEYAGIPKAATLMRGDYNNLPDSASLKAWCPVPGNQGAMGTCGGWAIGYAAGTILHAILNNWTEQEINDNVFSPSYIYNQLKHGPLCTEGISPKNGLDILLNEGIMKLKEFEYDCGRKVTELDKIRASKYKIKEYREVGSISQPNKVPQIRKSLAEKKPVVVALYCPPTFKRGGFNELWTPDSSEYGVSHEGHGICIVGYNDNKFGGAFEIINSWGKHWGNDGFAWIKYSDFNRFCFWACEINGEPVSKTKEPDINGELTFRLKSGQVMELAQKGSHFEMVNSYTSKTKFHLSFANNAPAYVYVITSDNSGKCRVLFPPDNETSAYLPYKTNNIDIPGEGKISQFDNRPGTDYYCFIYSKNSIDINSIKNKIEKSKGNFWDKIQSSFGNKTAVCKEYKIDDLGNLSFSIKNTDSKPLPIVVSIKHVK